MPNVQAAHLHGSVTAKQASQTCGAAPQGFAHAPADAEAEALAAQLVAGPESSGASPHSVWCVIIAFGAGLCATKLMSWRRMGLFARIHAPETSGERSTVDAPDSLFGDEPEPAPASAAPTRPVALTCDDALQEMSDCVMVGATGHVAVLNESAVPKWDQDTARLQYSPVSMKELERASLNAVSLGIMKNEADPDTIKGYTASVFVVFVITAIAVGKLGAQLSPGNSVRPTSTYVMVSNLLIQPVCQADNTSGTEHAAREATMAQIAPPVRPETAYELAAIAEAREMRQGTATGPQRVLMNLTNLRSPGSSGLVSLPPLPRDAPKYDDSGPVRHVFVKATTGRTMTARIRSWHDPISTIEAHMSRRQGTPAGLYRLVFAGKTLTHSHWTLAQYGIREGSTLEVLGRLRGGVPAKRETSGHTNGDDNMDTTEAPQPLQAANSSLQAWAKWVQGPYQALLRSAHFAQQLDEWELAFLEALTEQEIPEGAVAAMTTRAGMALNAAQATRAMAAYKGRRSLQPDFVNGVFRRVPGRDPDTHIAEAPPSPPPPQPHPTALEWARWVAGPYAAIESRSTYASDLDKWEVDMEEYLMEAEATQEQLAMIVGAAGIDMDRTATVRALGAYAARKHLRPDF